MASFVKPREENPISNSLQEALIYLNKQTIEEGKIYSRRYYTNPSKTEVDVVLAVGVLPGVGPSRYSIISYTKKVVVWGVSDSLPDVSEVTLGRLFIYWEPGAGRSYIVYLLAGDRIVEPISFPLIVHNVADSHMYYVSERSIVDIYEHLEGIFEMEERINTLEKQVKDLIENGGGSTEETTTPAPPVIDPEEPTTTTTTTTPKPVVNLVINSFKSESGEQFETGETVSPKLTWSYNTPVDTQSINDESIDLSLREFICPEITSNATYTLKATAGSTSRTKTISIKFSPKAFVGGGRVKADSVTADNFYEVFSGDSMDSDLSNIVCSGSTTKTFKFDQKSYILLAFPKEKCSNLVIKDLNNFDVTFHTKEVTVTNSYGASVTYVIYQSPAASTEFTFVFNF